MDRKTSRTAWAVVNLIGFVGTIVVNALSTTIPLGGKTPGELSDLYPNLFVPAGLTFSIWGVIYLLLAIYVVYGFVIARRSDSTESAMESIGPLFLVTSLANMGWIFAWQYEILPLSLVVMVVLLATLVTIYLRLRNRSSRPRERYLVHLPFSVYLGWISVATIANVTALLVAYHWSRFGLGETFWAVVMIIIACLLALLMTLRRTDIFYALVVDWALVGILIKRTSQNVQPNQAVVITTAIALALVSAAILVQIGRRKVYD